MLFNTEPAFITLTFIIKTKLCFRYKGIIYDPNYIDKCTLYIYSSLIIELALESEYLAYPIQVS